MDERIVQWVFLRSPGLLQECLEIELKNCLGSELTTSAGRLDLFYESVAGELLVIELETAIDSESKFKHCTEQLGRYRALEAAFPDRELRFVLLFATTGTPARFEGRLRDWADNNGVVLRTYSLSSIEERLGAVVDRVRRNSGGQLAGAVALGVSSLGWLNKVVAEFYRASDEPDSVQEPVSTLPYGRVRERFRSRTNFYVLKRLAEDFELVQRVRRKRKDLLCLTPLGEAFRAAGTDPFVRDALIETCAGNGRGLSLSTGQRRVLLQSLLTGAVTKSKANILYFLRLVHFYGGERIPKPTTRLSVEEQRYLNSVLRTSYGERTLRDLVHLSCCHSAELGLVVRVAEASGRYERVILTSLGARVLGYFELMMHLQREQVQIPLQI